MIAAAERPALTEAEALDDRVWFHEQPHRRYRARPAASGFWIVRRRSGGVLLRAWTATLQGIPDTDAALREQWFAAAWPDLSPLELAELIKNVKKGERLHEL